MHSASRARCRHTLAMTDTDATVIATYSRRMRLELESGEQVEARIKGKTLRAVCGDAVRAQPIANEHDWLITDVLPRRNALTRPNSRGHVEVLAANIDTLVVVAAVSPLPDWFIVDRYLCAAELMKVNSLVVFNKIDLLAGQDIEIPEITEYRDIGLPLLECSAEDGTGMDTMQRVLTDQRAIVVGQSGVGKSSLINRLVVDSQQRTAGISAKTGEGRHTTVNSAMLPIAGGGTIIDSPGVRDYAPALSETHEAALGFREIAAAAQFCRFANCKHLREPGCAVKAGIEADVISERRYESFKRVVNLTEQLQAGRY